MGIHEWLQMKVPNLCCDGIFKLLPRCANICMCWRIILENSVTSLEQMSCIQIYSGFFTTFYEQWDLTWNVLCTALHIITFQETSVRADCRWQACTSVCTLKLSLMVF